MTRRLTQADLAAIAAAFESSTFGRLRLSYGGDSVTFDRQPVPSIGSPGPSDSVTIAITAPTLGRFQAMMPTGAGPRIAAGGTVKSGETIAIIRRWKSDVPVLAPCAGTITAAQARDGDFVEFGEPLARLEPATLLPAGDRR